MNTDNFKSLRILIIIFLMTGLVITTCTSKSPPEPGRYYNNDIGFSIKYPPGWEIVEEDSIDTEITISSQFENDDDMFSEFIVITIEELQVGKSLSTYFEEINENSRMEYAHYKEEKRGEIIIDNITVKAVISSFTMAEGKLKLLAYCMIKENRGYIIACLAEYHKYDRYKEIFKEAVHSFRFE